MGHIKQTKWITYKMFLQLQPLCRSQCVNVDVFWAVNTWGQYVHIGFLSRCFIHIEQAVLGQGTYTVFTTLWEAKVCPIHHCKYVFILCSIK